MARVTPDLSQYSDLLAAIALKPKPPCDCERCFDDMEPDAPFVYECAGCKRTIPWCIGSDGFFPNGSSNFELCNDCVNALEPFFSPAFPQSA